MAGRVLDEMWTAGQIARLQDDATAEWHSAADARLEIGLLGLVRQQHRANFDLWHREDAARSAQASDAMIVEIKHAIDTLNQRRNDLVEQMDQTLLLEAGVQNEDAPLHSESPGLIVDRMSILALKIFHTEEEAHRESATEAHRARNLQRLQVLRQQRDDLAACLDALWAEVLAGTRRFRLYRQMKMYNDPDLNPVLYRNTV